MLNYVLLAEEVCMNDLETLKLAGIAYDYPDSGGYGGNTTTSEACRKFYRSPELRARLVDLCPPLYKAAFDKILSNDYTILRLISCRYRVMVHKIGEFLFCVLK